MGPVQRWLRHLMGLGLVGLLTACGFALQAPPELGVSRVYLQGFAARSDMVEALKQTRPHGVQWVSTPAQAELRIVASEDRFERTVVSSTAAGQVREFRLRQLLRFKLLDAQGQVLLPERSLELVRDMSTTETATLAKEVEQTELLWLMRQDMARQIWRMAATVTSPVLREPGGAASAAR